MNKPRFNDRRNGKDYLFIRYSEDEPHLPFAVGESLEELAKNYLTLTTGHKPNRKEAKDYARKIISPLITRGRKLGNPPNWLWVKVEWDMTDTFEDLDLIRYENRDLLEYLNTLYLCKK